MREKLIYQRKKKIRKWLYLFLMISIIVLVFFAKLFLPGFFKSLSIFNLKNVIIEPTDYASIVLDYISLPEGVNVLSINMPEIYSRIRQLYFVEDCFIEKHLPDTLLIRLKIRKPWVLIVDSETIVTMDRNGYFLPAGENFVGWVVEGIKAGSTGERSLEQGKIDVLKEIEQWYNYYRIASIFKIDKISLGDLDKIELKSWQESIYIHSEEIEKQMAVAKEVLSDCRKNNFPLEYIDVRFKEPYIKERMIQQ